MEWTPADISYLANFYPTECWDTLLSKLPHSKDTIIHKACELGIKRVQSSWSDDDLLILTNAYAKKMSAKEISLMLGGRFTESAIRTKACKLGLKSRQEWTPSEVELLQQHYETTPAEDLLSMFPGRTVRTIQDKARSIGLHAYAYLNRSWTKEDDDYIRSHWKAKTDTELAAILDRTLRAVKWRREKLGLFREVAPGTYEYLRKYLWKTNREWRKKSIAACNYQCIVTGGRFSDVHHLYASNLILQEVLDDLGLEYGKVQTFTQNQLETIADKYAEYHAHYPLGVCLSSFVHKQFHDLYGYGNNTPEQFQAFLAQYYPQVHIPVTIKTARVTAPFNATPLLG